MTYKENLRNIAKALAEKAEPEFFQLWREMETPLYTNNAFEELYDKVVEKYMNLAAVAVEYQRLAVMGALVSFAAPRTQPEAVEVYLVALGLSPEENPLDYDACPKCGSEKISIVTTVSGSGKSVGLYCRNCKHKERTFIHTI